MPVPWYRVWTDILDSEKFAELDDATIGGWTLILSAVKRFNHDGLLPPDKKLCHWTRRNKGTVAGWIESLLEAELLEPTADGVRVHDWDRWQEPKDRTNAQRQAKFKAAHKAPPAPPKTEPETDNRHRPDQTVIAAPLPAGDNGAVTALPGGECEPFQSPVPESPKPDPLTDRVIALADEVSAGGLGAWASNRLRLGESPAWVESALREGVDAQKLSPQYLAGILRRYHSEGGPSPLAKATARRDTGAKSPDSSHKPWETPERIAKAEATKRELADIKARKEANGHL